MDKDKRIISDKQRTWLVDEMSLWQQEAMMHQDQAARILDLYETVDDVAERRRSKFIHTLMSVAAFLVGLAVLLLIGYNWEVMPRTAKLITIFGIIVGTYTAAFYMRYKRMNHSGSDIVFFLGSLFYGAGIWLIAQIYHLDAHYPDGVWWWALGVLPLAFLLDTFLLHALLASLLAMWAGLEIFGFGFPQTWIMGYPIPHGAYTLPLLALPGLIQGYRKKSTGVAGMYVLVLTWWVVLQPVALQWESNPIFFIASIGPLLLMIAENHRVGNPLAGPYRLYGVLLTGGVLTLLSYYDFNQEIFDSGTSHGNLVQTITIIAVAVVTLLIVIVMKQRYGNSTMSLSDQLRAMIYRQWLPFSLLLVMIFMSVWSVRFHSSIERDTAAMLPTVLANIAMIGCAIWLMAVGLREDRGRTFAGGVLYFLLWAVLRYIDLFGDFGGMLGAALMFLLCAAVLFGVAMFWRRRKEVAHV